MPRVYIYMYSLTILGALNTISDFSPKIKHFIGGRNALNVYMQYIHYNIL